MFQKIIIGIVTVSDRASAGIYEDISGLEIKRTLKKYLISKYEIIYKIIPDEQVLIENTLIELSDTQHCCLIFTTGGTGPAERDVTPEATENVCQKMMPGFGELMRFESSKYVPTAILSRQCAGIRNGTLIVNLPGKPSAIKQCMDAVFPAVPYCLDIIGSPYIECNPNEIKIFRPSQTHVQKK